MSNEISSFEQGRNKLNMFNLLRLCPKDAISFDIVAKKPQQCRSNIRLCRKNRSTCSIRQCCFDIVAGVDGALLSIQQRRPQQPIMSPNFGAVFTERYNKRVVRFPTNDCRNRTLLFLRNKADQCGSHDTVAYSMLILCLIMFRCGPWKVEQVP